MSAKNLWFVLPLMSKVLPLSVHLISGADRLLYVIQTTHSLQTTCRELQDIQHPT